MTLLGIDFTLSAVALGALGGMTYGLLAIGLIIVYRSSGVINFAHAQTGWFAAVVMAVAVNEWRMPYVVAVVIALGTAAVIGAGTEAAVVRRLSAAPPLMSLVATLGVAQFLYLLSFVIYKAPAQGRTYPLPPGLPAFHIGILVIDPAHTAMLVFSPIVVVGLALFLRKSRFGLALLGAAANPNAARAAGISASRMSTLAWALGGALSAYTAILVLPAQPFVTAAFGPALLVRALAAAVIARMTNLPFALAAGIAIGVVEEVTRWNYPAGGPTDLLLFFAILIPLMLRRELGGRTDERRGSHKAVEPWPRLPDVARAVPSIRAIAPAVAVVSLLMALLLPAMITNRNAVVLISVVTFALVGVSVGIVAGLAGELSLGQFAVAGVGAAVAYHVTLVTGYHVIGLVAAGVAGAVASVLVGLPALRIRGLMLAVTTLAFALTGEFWLFGQSWMFGEGVSAGRPIIGDHPLNTSKEYYYFALAVLVAGMWLARNYWRGGLRRRLVALRDNEGAARAFAIRAVSVKLQAFAFAGFLAGIGGATLAYLPQILTTRAFPASAGVDVVAMAALGGIGLLAGPILGALYIIGLPAFVSLEAAGLAGTSVGWLLLLLYFPGGIAQVIRPLRERVVRLLAQRAGIDPDSALSNSVDDNSLPSVAFEAGMPAVTVSEGGLAVPPGPLLRVAGLSKTFGGVRAVREVSLELHPMETLGIIGPNGAGKTTLFELIGGFTRADAGSVEFLGRDVTRTTPEARAQLGLIRSFQDAALFPTMTVLEVIGLAQERLAPTRFAPEILGFHRADRQKEANAQELVGLLGLHRYRNNQIAELSTGTRRIVDLTCLLALRPKVLLLDEPSSGIAQRETEALAEVLQRVTRELGTSVVLIEHDMPLLMGLADRVVAMESGQVLAEGTPEEIQSDARVIDSYLGGAVTALQRADIPRKGVAGSGNHSQQCTSLTRAGERCSRSAGAGGVCAQHQRQLAAAGRGRP